MVPQDPPKGAIKEAVVCCWMLYEETGQHRRSARGQQWYAVPAYSLRGKLGSQRRQLNSNTRWGPLNEWTVDRRAESAMERSRDRPNGHRKRPPVDRHDSESVGRT